MHLTLRCAPLLAATLFTSVATHGQSIAIQNFDFSNHQPFVYGDTQSDGSYTATVNYYNAEGTPSGWSTVGTAEGGVFSPSESINYAIANDTPTPIGTMSGGDAYYGFGNNGDGIYQTTGAVLTTSTQLQLTVSLGARADQALGQSGTLTLELLASSGSGLGTVLASQDVINTVGGTFSDFSLNYSYTSANSSLLGENIQVAFVSDNSATYASDINNVRLTAVPEPRTYCVIAGVGAFLAVGLGRRRLLAV